MKILLIGGNSALGQVLHPVLARFADVVVAGRSDCDVDLDLTWPPERFKLPKAVDTAINLAAHFGGGEVASMLAAEEVNALGTLKLAQACHHAKIRHLVQISSIYAGLSEASSFYSSYAVSKRHGEELAQLYCRSVSLPLTVLRPAQFYGEGESFRRHQPFLYALLDKAQGGDEIVLHGRNDAIRNYIHVSDVAEVIARVAQQRIEGRYNCAALSNVRISEIAAAAVSVFDSSSAIRFDPDSANIPDNAVAADDTLYRLIGYFPRISLARGLAGEAERRKASP